MMELPFYKPNRAGSGSAFRFKLVPDRNGDLGFLFTSILQAIPLQGRAGDTAVFEPNKDLPDKNTVGKLSEVEVADIVRVIEQVRFRAQSSQGQSPYPPSYSLRFYHQSGGASKTIEFYPLNLNGRDGERLAFSFTVKVGQPSSGGSVFRVALEPGEAFRLSMFFRNGIHAIDQQRFRRQMAYYRHRTEPPANPGPPTSVHVPEV